MKHLNQLTLVNAIAAIKSKKISCLELTKSCLKISQKLNPTLNAYNHFNSQAIKQAQKADQEISKHPDIFLKKPLLGIPYALKDNFCTKGVYTTASSNVLKNYLPIFESTVSQRLNQAGAILIGKTNMDAWAHGSSTETSDFGPSLNPHNLNHLPGGSSGGSAAAIAADLAIFAIGSETAGSIRQPASWCGVTGLKPTYGRCSRYGVIAMASSTDSPGPITKTAADAKYILEVIAGNDPLDATSIPQKSWSFSNFNINKKLKIGIVTDYFLSNAQSGVNQLVKKAIKDLSSHSQLEFIPVSLLDPKYAIAVYTILQRSEVSSNLARFDGIRYANDRSYFNSEAKRRMMFGAYALSSGYYDAYYKKALKARTKILADFKKVFSQVDLLIAPTTPCVALKLGATKGQAMFGEMQDVLVEASSIAGLPGISIPCGFINKLPVGLQIFGQAQDETNIIKLANYYQSITDWHTQKPNLN